MFIKVDITRSKIFLLEINNNNNNNNNNHLVILKQTDRIFGGKKIGKHEGHEDTVTISHTQIYWSPNNVHYLLNCIACNSLSHQANRGRGEREEREGEHDPIIKCCSWLVHSCVVTSNN